MVKRGSLEVICGSMFSGKSEELIRRLRRAQYAKQAVQVFKPKLDNRYSEKSVVSHNGTVIQALPIENVEEILKLVTETTDVVGIDEAQFFNKEIVPVVNMLASQGYRVLVAGLDQDFRGKPFGSMPELMAIAESVTKLQAICSSCGALASRTQRLIDGMPAFYDDPIILVGASESYEARCRDCHSVPQRVLREQHQ